MEFSSYKFEPKSGLNFPGHKEVLDYIEDFAKEYQLYPHIKFQHLVRRISKEINGWKIICKNFKNNRIEEEHFDGVMICNGHHAKPNIPHIPGIETFEGDQIHSYYYKCKAPYKNKNILIVGNGSSGLDISLECAEVANKVYISVRNEHKFKIFREKIEIKPGIIKIDSKFVTFTDATTVQIDSIILCTGYIFHLPFLDESCCIDVHENLIVRPLFKIFINIRQPTMCFIGLPKKTVIFPLVDLQARVFLKYLAGQICLPSTDSMLQWENEEHRKKLEEKVPATNYHLLGEKMEEYMNDLASLGQTETLSKVYFKIYAKCHETSSLNTENSKKQNFQIIDNESFLWELI